jgi:hypothetical protein
VSIPPPTAAHDYSLVVAPDTDTTWGIDISTFVENDEGEADIDTYFGPIYGKRVLAEQVLRGWTMEHGEMWDSPDDGYDVRNQVSARFDSNGAKAFRVGSAMELDAENTLGIKKCAVAINQNLPARSLTVAATITPDTGAPFDLVAAIGQVTTELLSPQ